MMLRCFLGALSVAVLVACGGNGEPTPSKMHVEIPLANWRASMQTTEFDGHHIAYWEAGDPRRETIVLIHGFPSAAWDWQHLWLELSDDYHLVALDLLGYGWSAKPQQYDFHIHEQADVVMHVAEALHVERFHLIAHDYGVSVAQELLARHLEAGAFIKSLYLLNGGLFPETQRHPWTMTLLKGPLGPFLVKFQSESQFNERFSAVFAEGNQPSSDQLSGYWQLLSENNGIDTIPYLMSYIDERHTRRERWVGALQNADVPVRLVVGQQDPISGEHMAKHYEQVIGDADIVRLPDVGHYPQLEAPDRVLLAYREFMGKQPR